MKRRSTEPILIFVILIATFLLLSAGCSPRPVSTAAPTSEPTSQPVFTSTLAASPTSQPTSTPAVMPPKSGEWVNFADNLGRFAFEVSTDGKSVTLASVDFEGFTCQERGMSGKWLPEGYTAEIVDRAFALGGMLSGYMELSFSGMQPGVNPFPTVTFSGEFDEAGTRASGTWEVDWDGKVCSGTWSSVEGERASATQESVPKPSGKPTQVTQEPALEPYYLYPFCNCQEQVPSGMLPTLRWAWLTTSKIYTLDFINASKTVVTIDGMTFADLDGYWGDVAYSAEDGGYKSLWIWELPPLTAGVHLVESNLSLDRAVTDGYDTNGDGKEDQYGPGETFYGWVEVQLQAASGSSSAACPNGAPAGYWALIVIKGSAGDGTISIDGEAVSIKSGENTIYLSIEASHAIKVGTNTFNFSAPECGENTVSVP